MCWSVCRLHEEYGDVIWWLLEPAAPHQEVSVLFYRQMDRVHYTFPISPLSSHILSVFLLWAFTVTFFCWLLSPPVPFCLTLSTFLLIPVPQQKETDQSLMTDVQYIRKKTQCNLIFSPPSLFSYLSSMRTQRSLKCLCRCFFCLFLLFFFSIFLSAFSRSSRLSAGRSMWGNRSSSRGRPWSSSLWGSSWRKGSRRGDSSW